MKKRLCYATFVCVFLCACGGGGGSSQPAAANRAPVASGQSVATDPGSTVTGTLQASDADGDALSFSAVTQPASGTLSLSGAGNRNFEYVPDAGFSGTDSFTFNASDSQASSAAATVTINVNTRPAATAAAYSSTDIVEVSDTLQANDVEGDTIRFSIATQPSRGTITSLDAATGAFVYTPTFGEDGVDSFGFVASDDFQASAEQSVTIEIFGWAGTQQFGTSERDLATTGGLFFSADGSLTFGGSTLGQLAAAPAGQDDAYVRRIDRRGNELWTVQYGDVLRNNARIIREHPQGSGIYVISTSSDPNLDDSVTVSLFDNSGIEQWAVPVDFQGNPPLVGAYWGGIDIAGDVYVLSWDDDFASGLSSVISKVSGADGALVWERRLLNSSADPVSPFLANSSRIQLRSIDVDAAGQLVIAGMFFDDGGGRACSLCSFIAALDADGNDLWTTEIDDFGASCNLGGGEAPIYRVTVDASGDLIAVGSSIINSPDGVVARFNFDASQQLWTHCDDHGANEDTFSFTPAYPTADGGFLIFTAAQGENDPMTGEPTYGEIVVKKLDADGNQVFRTVIQGQTAAGAAAILGAGSIVEGPLGSIFVTAWSNGEQAGAPGAGDADVVVIRLDQDGNVR